MAHMNSNTPIKRKRKRNSNYTSGLTPQQKQQIVSWSEEERDFLIQNKNGNTWKEITEKLNQQFPGKDRKVNSVKCYFKKYCHISADNSSRMVNCECQTDLSFTVDDDVFMCVNGKPYPAPVAAGPSATTVPSILPRPPPVSVGTSVATSSQTPTINLKAAPPSVCRNLFPSVTQPSKTYNTSKCVPQVKQRKKQYGNSSHEP